MITFPILKGIDNNSKNLNTFPFIKQYYYSQKAIENFIKTITSELNRVEKVYLIYSAARCLRALLYNGYARSDEKIFYFFDLNKENTIYNEAKKFNETFIDNLTENSEMYSFLLQINSGSSINKLINDLSSRISMLKLQQIKEHLKKKQFQAI